MSWLRILALLRRYTYLYQRSPTRVLELVFWPIMDLLLWGFLTTYLQRTPALPSAVGFLLGSCILWDVLYRSQLALTVAFLEDIWTRNLINLFVSPMRLSEFIAAMALTGLVRIILLVLLMGGLASSLYAYHLTALGWAMIPLFANLIWLGWSMGLFTVALILRFGQAAENLAWGVPFLIQPLSGVFYPISVLPAWAQPVSLLLPSAHVFEGMRQILAGQAFPLEHLLAATSLNLVFFALAALFFRTMYAHARAHGTLARLGTQ